MLGTDPTTISGVLNATLPAIEQDAMVNLMAARQNYHAYDMMMQAPNARTETNMIYGWQYTLQHNESGERPGWYAGIEVVAPDSSSRAQMYVTKNYRTHYGWDDHEMDANGNNKHRILDELKRREMQMDQALMDMVESDFWGLTTVAESASSFFGIQNMITINAGGTPGTNQPLAATSTAGFGSTSASFSGSNATGWSTSHNIDRGTNEKLRNANALYVTIDRDDFLPKFRACNDMTNFKAPISGIKQLGGRMQREYFTNWSVRNRLKELSAAQGQDLGFDLSGPDPIYESKPVKWVSFLDSNTNNPIYGINWACIYPVWLGRWKPKKYPFTDTGKPFTAVRIHTFTCNIAQVNPRGCFVMATGTFG